MRVLGTEMSTAFQGYYHKCLQVTGIEPEWVESSEVPYGRIRWRRPEGQRIPTIWLNLNHPQNVIEHTAAHELTHIVQFYQGYPHVQSARLPGNAALSQALATIASTLTDLIMDPDAEKHLKPYGLWVSERFDAGFERIRTTLPSATTENDKPGMSIFLTNSLQYAYAKKTLTVTQWQIAHGLFQRYMPNTSRLGEIIYKKLPRDTCDTELKAKQAYQDIMNELGIQKYLRLWAPNQQQ